MKLISLKLLHYRRFRQQEIIFKDDLSLIFGKNGAGKSSVLDAIGYALFGPSSKDFVRVNRCYLKSYFSHDKEPSKIELIFQYGFDTYKIVRIIDAGTKKFASDFIVETKDTLLGSNGVEVIGGDEITYYINELIGVNKETFLKSVFAKQKDLEVLSGGLSERKELINKILGLDKIESIILSFRLEEKEKKALLEIYKKNVSEFDLEAIKIKKEEISLSLKNISKELESEYNLLKILNETFSKTKIDFELQDKKRQTFQDFGNQVNSILKLNESLKIQNESITLEIQKIISKELYLKQNSIILETEKRLYNSLEKQNQNKIFFEEKKKLEISLETYKKDLESLNRFLSDFVGIDLVKQIEDIDKELKELELQKEEITKIKTGFEGKREIILGQYNNLKQELENIKKLDTKADCPTCKRTLEGYLPKFIKYQEENINIKLNELKNIMFEIDKLIKKIDIIQEKLIQKKIKIEDLKNKEKEFIKYSQNKINLEKNISYLIKKLKEIGEVKFDEKEFNKLKIEYEKVKNIASEYLKIEGEVRNKHKLEENFTNNLSKINNNIKELDNLNNRIRNLEFNEESYQKIKEIYFTINTQINEKNKQIQSINKDKLTQEFELKNIEKLENDFIENKKNIDLYVSELNDLALKKQIMSDYIIYLLNYLKPHIEDLASDYFSIITDYKYTSISLDDDYNIMIDGKNIYLYSGGERDLANLCLRLSLGQNLTSSKGNPINFLVLDEVLASQDKNRQQNILINLKKLENKFSQIILISHLEEIKDLATNLIEIKAINRDESIVNYY